MYSVNGVPLSNPAMGWRLRFPSQRFSQHAKRVQQIYVPGLSGVVTTDAPVDAPILQLVVRTSAPNLPVLYSVFMAQPTTLTFTADPSRSVGFQYISTSITEQDPRGAWLDVTFSIRLDGAFWRDAEVGTTTAVTLSSGNTTVDVFSGISAPIEDALVKVIGPTAANVTVTDDQSQAAFQYTAAIAAGKALVYDCADETATLVSDPSTWFGGTDVSGSINFFGDRFKITPFMPTPTDPTTRVGRLIVNASSVTSASKCQVQGQGAYVV